MWRGVNRVAPLVIPYQPPKNQTSACRICLDNQGEMISPCQCSGSIKHVHQNCLKIWIQQQNPNYQQASCEVCHTQFKMLIEYQKKCAPNGYSNQLRYHWILLSFLILIFAILGVFIFYLSKYYMEQKESLEYFIASFICVCVVGVFVIASIIIRCIKEICVVQTMKNWVIFNQKFVESQEMEEESVQLVLEKQEVSQSQSERVCSEQKRCLRSIEDQRWIQEIDEIKMADITIRELI